MKIKDCLSCRMDEQRTLNFLEHVIERIVAGDEEWEKDLKECAEEDPESTWPLDFLDHMFKEHEDEYLELCGETLRHMRKIVKEVF